MSDAGPFLSAIHEAPHNDQPRLVYADWLDKRGDPRGEFIRVQYELERPDAREDLLPDLRERELLGRHGVAWRSELPWAGRLGVFSRGFLRPKLELAARQFLNRDVAF